MPEFPDYYAILGVAPTASSSEIKRAYRRCALQLHPDVSPAADAEERFKELNEAYQVLSVAIRRAVYDRMRRAAVNIAEDSRYVRMSPQDRRTAAVHEWLRAIRSPVIPAFVSFIAFVGGMAIFQTGIAGVWSNVGIVLAASVASFLLYRYAMSRVEEKVSTSLKLSETIEGIAVLLTLAALAGAVAILVLLFTGVILLEPYVPGLTMGVMYSFPVLLSLTTIWVIISVFRRDPAQSIQISRTPRK